MSSSRISLALLPLFLALIACDPTAPPEPVDACGDKCGEGQVCIENECRDKICEPFSKSCADASTLQTCNGNGTSILEDICLEGTACVGDTCAPTICIPDTHFCGSDGERKLCDAAGIEFSSDPCPAGQGCTDGDCVTQICTPLTVQCLTEGTREVERCSPSGTEYYSDTCSANELCYGDECLRVVCADGERACLDGQTSAECDSTGTGYTNEVICDGATGSICDPTTGGCASACEVAASTKSYIGCDYWFAVTDNGANDLSNKPYLVADDHDVFSCEMPADPFPSAVVIANTNDVPVQVTLYDADGAIVTLPPQQNPQEMPIPQPDILGNWTCMANGTTTASVDSKILVGSTVSTVLNGQAVDQLEVPPGATAQLLIVSTSIDMTQIAHAGYNLVSSLPVSATFFNPICCNFSYSNDASLLIPRTAWRQAYFVVTAPHLAGSNGGLLTQAHDGRPTGFAIIAAEDQTQIAIRMRPGQTAAQFYLPAGFPTFSGDELRTTINKGDVLQLETRFSEPRSDVTGVLAAADKPIGVIAFHECTNVPVDQGACDHVEEMLLPIETWGTDYIAVMPKMRNTDLASAENNERMYYRVVSSANTNRIQVLPRPGDVAVPHDTAATPCQPATDGSFVLDEGQYCEFGSRDNFKFTADSPILVAALFAGQQATGLGWGEHAGDPSLTQLVPVDQYRRDYSFLTPDTYYADYVTVVFKESSTIELDGTTVNPSLLGPYGANELVEAGEEVTGSGFHVMTIKLARGAHSIRSVSAANPSAPGDRFGIYSYGYDDYVSYAFPGGLDLVQTSTYPNMPAFP